MMNALESNRDTHPIAAETQAGPSLCSESDAQHTAAA
jgi:hypothetical protein